MNEDTAAAILFVSLVILLFIGSMVDIKAQEQKNINYQSCIEKIGLEACKEIYK